MDAGRKNPESLAFVIAVCIGVTLSLGFVSWNRIKAHSHNPVSLDEKVNPNEAPVESLIRLPGIGIGRAAEIEAYREQYKQSAQDRPFESCDDLQKVRSLGPATVKNIKRWVTFEKSNCSPKKDKSE